MFLHEVPRKGIARVLAEAHRVLRPGGLMLHMELPPNSQLSPFDAFYLDWDSYYNNEPFYKPYRDLRPEQLCIDAGFAPGRYVQFVIPSVGWYGEEAFARALAAQDERRQRQDRATRRWPPVVLLRSLALSERKPLPRSIRGPRPAFYADPAVDKLLSTVLQLAAEVWTLRERLAAMEAIARERGTLATRRSRRSRVLRGGRGAARDVAQ